jgi:hypothetical protein
MKNLLLVTLAFFSLSFTAFGQVTTNSVPDRVFRKGNYDENYKMIFEDSVYAGNYDAITIEEQIAQQQSYSFIVSYKIDLENTLNQPFNLNTGYQNKKIIEGLIYSTLEGIIRPYQSELLNSRMSEEIYKDNLNRAKQNNANYLTTMYLVVRKLYHYNTQTKQVTEKKTGFIESQLLLYSETKEEDIFIGAYLIKELIDNILMPEEELMGGYRFPFIWTNPLDITDKRTYSEVFLNNWYYGKMVEYIDIKEQDNRKVSKTEDLNHLKEKYANFPIILDKIFKYEHSFSIEDTKPSKQSKQYQEILTYRDIYSSDNEIRRDTISFPTFYSQNEDKLFLTNIFYTFQNGKKDKSTVAHFIQKTNDMTNIGLLRTYESDSLNKRQTNYTQHANSILKISFEELMKSENLITQQLEMEIKLSLGSDRKTILFPYEKPLEPLYKNYTAISFYVKPNFSKTGKRELLASYSFTELYQNAIKDNPELKEWDEKFKNKKLNLQLTSYINTITGKKVILNTDKDLLPLSTMLKMDIKELKKLLTNPKL